MLCISKYKIVCNTISFCINLLQCHASHRLKQFRCLALAVIVFCLTIDLCDVSVGFFTACYVGFGPIFFCTYEECKALINLSDSPQGHPRFDILATSCCMHVAHGHSTLAEAFTLLKFCLGTHPGIHSAGARPCFCVFSASTAAPRCSTVRAAG